MACKSPTGKKDKVPHAYTTLPIAAALFSLPRRYDPWDYKSRPTATAVLDDSSLQMKMERGETGGTEHLYV